LLTITGGHTIDALCYCLGEFRELAAFVVSQRDRIPVEETGEIVAKTAPDQLASMALSVTVLLYRFRSAAA
jgi:predicted dehydrogenase